MLFYSSIEKHENVVIPINLTSWKSQKINTQQEKPIFYISKNWFPKNKIKKNTRLSEKLNIRKKTRAKQYFKGQRPVFNTAPGVSTNCERYKLREITG